MNTASALLYALAPQSDRPAACTAANPLVDHTERFTLVWCRAGERLVTRPACIRQHGGKLVNTGLRPQRWRSIGFASSRCTPVVLEGAADVLLECVGVKAFVGAKRALQAGDRHNIMKVRGYRARQETACQGRGRPR